MKNKTKNMLAIIAIGITLTACKQEIDKSVIESFTTDNKILEQKVTDMKMFRTQILSGQEKKYGEMLNTIDSKKKVMFDKDNTLQPELKNAENNLVKIADKYESNYNALVRTIESNTSFISAIPTSEKDENTIKADWQKNMVVSNEFVKTNNNLQKEMTDLLREYGELTKQVIKKYGKTETVKKVIKKK